jgi:metal-responsive CopG/Arc/MetJ family transcriptional regulator
MKRGAVQTAESKFLGVWIPKPLVVLMESAMGHADRSKFIRAALRERIARKQAKKVGANQELLKS